MRQRDSEYTDDDNVIDAGTDVFGVIEFRDSDVAGFPGQKDAKGQQ